MKILTTADMLLLLLSHTAILLTVTAQHQFNNGTTETLNCNKTNANIYRLSNASGVLNCFPDNLTPFGTATQSSTQPSGFPQHAIKPPVSNAFSHEICSHTGIDTRTPAWWMFQFSFGIAYITDITIYYRESFAHRMDGFKLYVTNTSTIPPDGYLCYEDPDPGLPNITQTIPCNQLGQYVIYYDTKNDSSYGPIIELCYVAINGCRKGFWGNNCKKVCSTNCVDQHCYPGNGSCIFGCNSDYCLNDICNKFTGICTDGCKKRRTGDFCNQYNLAYDSSVLINPNSSYPGSLANDGNKISCSKTKGPIVTFQVDLKEESIVTGVNILFGEHNTKFGNHSLYASNTSNSWKTGTILNEDRFLPSKINVSAVFRYLTYEPPVQDTSSELEVCEIGILGCPPSHYGSVCNKLCPGNCNGPCDLEAGNCIFGCLNGWIGNKCEQACQNGKYGKNCLETCSPFCSHTPCDRITGDCTDGCIPGVHGTNCMQVSVNTAESDNEVTTRIGIFIGGVLLGILITVAVCFVIRKKRQSQKKQGKDNVSKKTQSQDPQHYDDVRMENVNTYQDLRMETGANEYDQISQINTAYDNH